MGARGTRTSVLPIEEVDISGNNLCVFTAHPIQGTPEVSQRTLQPLQLIVQFIRVSTDAKIVRMEEMSLFLDGRPLLGGRQGGALPPPEGGAREQSGEGLGIVST